jgi:predicted phage terminase large subunit-like protein
VKKKAKPAPISGVDRREPIPEPGYDALVQSAIADPDAMELLLDKADCEDSFIEFVRKGWHILEPARPFVEGWHLGAVAEHLEAVTYGQIKRLVINIPPGCTKSRFVNVYWPAWEWGPLDRPWTQFISASYSEALSIRDNRHCRALMLSGWYQQMWGDRFQLLAEQNQKIRYDNTKTGWRFATSVGGVATGERGDRFIIDDPHNVKEAESSLKRESALQWFSEVVTTRFNDEESAMVVIMQRVHEDDVTGMILAKELDFEHLCLPMEYEADHPYPSKTSLNFKDPRTKPGELLCPGRFSAAEVERLKKTFRAWGGVYAEAGQLQQRPAPRGGGMFRRDDFVIADTAPKDIRHTARGWDLAASKGSRSSWTVGVKLGVDGEGRVWVLDVRRIRGTPYEVETLLKKTAELDGKDCIQDLPQDPGQAGKTQKAALARVLHGYIVRFSAETGSKETRAQPLAAQAEAGNLLLVRASWNDAYIDEFASFPRGADDDQVDGTSRCYARIITMTSTQNYHFAAPEVIRAR